MFPQANECLQLGEPVFLWRHVSSRVSLMTGLDANSSLLRQAKLSQIHVIVVNDCY